MYYFSGHGWEIKTNPKWYFFDMFPVAESLDYLDPWASMMMVGGYGYMVMAKCLGLIINMTYTVPSHMITKKYGVMNSNKWRDILININIAITKYIRRTEWIFMSHSMKWLKKFYGLERLDIHIKIRTTGTRIGSFLSFLSSIRPMAFEYSHFS